MKVLIVCRYKDNFAKHILPFVTEQGEALVSLGVNVDYFTIKGKGLFAYFRSSSALKKKIREFAPDVVHAHYGLSGITAVLQRRVPVVVTFHNGETLSVVTNLLSSFFSLFAKHTIYVAQHIYDLSYFKHKSNYTILPCGISLEECVVTDKSYSREEMKLSKDKKYILFGGAFSNLRKNYPLLQKAIQLLDRNDIEVLEMNGLSRSEITKLMCACDVFALPSKSEGSPQALKEAMACNCPIVATDIADIKYLLGNIDGHYLCSFDAIDVANKLQKALQFGERTNGRKRIIELGFENKMVAQKIMTIYGQIVKVNNHQ